jgi:hypothetical protein
MFRSTSNFDIEMDSILRYKSLLNSPHISVDRRAWYSVTTASGTYKGQVEDIQWG